MSELVTEATNINEEAGQLMKFHGSYQQDNREKRTLGQGKFYQFMMRTRQPAGVVTNQLYLTMDDLSNEVIVAFQCFCYCSLDSCIPSEWPKQCKSCNHRSLSSSKLLHLEDWPQLMYVLPETGGSDDTNLL